MQRPDGIIKRSESRNRSLLIVTAACWTESFLLDMFDNPEKVFYLKEINEKAVAATTRCGSERDKYHPEQDKSHTQFLGDKELDQA